MKWVVIKEASRTIPIEAEAFRVHDSGALILYNKCKKSSGNPDGQVLISAFRDWRGIVKSGEEKNWN